MASTSIQVEGQGHAFLEFFATDEAIAVLEINLLAATDSGRLAALIPLAWQLRQRDGARSLVLADEAEARLALAEMPDSEKQRVTARLMLIRGEAKWLFGELDASKTLSESALQCFTALDDALGCADAHWLRGWIALHMGDFAQRDAELEMAAVAAENCDPLRVTVAQATLARLETFRDVAVAKKHWDAQFPATITDLHPAAACAVQAFLGAVAGQSSDYVESIRCSSLSHTLALASGQIRFAIVVATNIGNQFNNLNDYHVALEWMQRGLDLARRCGWPDSMGSALVQSAETLRCLQRFDAAHNMLREALAVLAPLPTSSMHAVALGYLGEVELDRQQYASALESFQSQEQGATAISATELLIYALRGQARALLQLNQPLPALEKVHASLAAAKSSAHHQIDALQVLAEIHARHPLPPAQGMNSAGTPLHYLNQALALAASVENYTIPEELLESVAREYAKLGDTGKAYELVLQAIEAREKIHSTEASNRASAIQVSHEAERARAEGEHHRQLALANAARADTLQQANATLEQLGAIGREITSSLDPAAIFAAVDAHVHALLEAPTFAIYRMDADGKTLKMAFGVEAGLPLPPYQFRIDDPVRPAARCARERQDIVFDATSTSPASPLPDTLATVSMMFSPLLVGERLLGVMTIQSPQPHAYGEREVAIFRTLCAYGAIALANGEAQAQLIQSEKMASLGQLVANVAHEINTPIAAVKSSGMNIAEALERLQQSSAAFAALDLPTRQLFAQLENHARAGSAILSTREERVIVQDVTRQLEEAGFADARRKAELIVQLNAQSALADYYPLLRHPDVELILNRARSTATIINGTANINTATERVARIVFALKSFSRVDKSGEMTQANLADGMETVLTIYENQIRQGTELVRRYEDMPLLRCLPDELNQIWTNLIHNALQAMDYKGTLTIGIRQIGNDAVVSVGDTGCGIVEAIRSRIFNPFFTTKPTGEGSGLGLDIVKKIVDKHSGRIEVQSVVGVGTTFVVSLPFDGISRES